jgi:hypothetical protein
MKKKKNKISLTKILIIFFIIIIPVAIGILSLYKQTVEQNNSSKGGQYSHKDNSLVQYNQDAVNKLHDLQQNKQPLSPADEVIKNDLINRGNPLAVTEDYTITYDLTTDSFQTQINTIDINDAKDEVVEWFTNQGMSTEAICNLPLSFTLEDSVAQSLKGLDIIFSPLAPGC